MLSWAFEFRRSAIEAQARAESREARAASRTSLTVSGWPRPGRDNPMTTQAAANLNLKARRLGPPSAPPGSGNATESVKSELDLEGTVTPSQDQAPSPSPSPLQVAGCGHRCDCPG